MLSMRMELRPMQYMALACTGCGRFLSKPQESAGDEEIHDAMCAAAGLDYLAELEQSVQRKVCRKCGRPFRRFNRKTS